MNTNTPNQEQAPAKIHPQTGAPSDPGTAQTAAIPQAHYAALFNQLTTLEDGIALLERAGALLRILEERTDDEQKWLQDAGRNAFVQAYLARSKDTRCLMEAAQEIFADALQTIERATEHAFTTIFAGKPAEANAAATQP